MEQDPYRTFILVSYRIIIFLKINLGKQCGPVWFELLVL